MEYRTKAGKDAAERAKRLLISVSTSRFRIPASEVIEAVDAIVEAAVAESGDRAGYTINSHVNSYHAGEA
jgi:hypothetical protein